MVTPLAANLDIEQFIQDIQNHPSIWDRAYHCNKTFMEETWFKLAKLHDVPMQTLKSKWKGLRDNFRVEFKRIPRDDNGEMLIEADEYPSKWIHYKSLLFLTEHMRSRQPKNEMHDPYYFEVHPQNSSDYNDGYNYSNDGDDEFIQLPNYYPQVSYQQEIASLPVPHQQQQLPSNIISFKGKPINMGTLKLADTNDDSETTIKLVTKRKRLNSDVEIISGNIQEQIDNEKPESSTADEADNGTSSTSLPPVAAMDDDHHFLMSLHPYMLDLTPVQKLRIRMKIQKLIFKELYKDEAELEDK